MNFKQINAEKKLYIRNKTWEEERRRREINGEANTAKQQQQPSHYTKNEESKK